MDPLTFSLAVLGGVVIAGMVAHGAWASRRAGPKRMRSPEERVEPRDGAAADALVPPVDDAGLDATTDADPEWLAEPPTDAQPPSRRRGRQVPRLDALIDAIVSLVPETPVTGAAVLAQLPATPRAGTKPVLIEGLAVEGLGVESGEWEPPSPGLRYRELQAGVQLANRTGALNEIEFSEFVQKVQALADAVGAMVDLPDMLEVVARARELDHFASQHDAQLALRLRARGAAWSVAYLQSQALVHGFRPGVVPGRLVRPSADEGGPPVLTLTFDAQAALADDPNQAAVREVTLNFDVPQTDPAAAPFAAWRGAAEALATSLETDLVDDRGTPLHPAGFDAIQAELGQLYRALEARDLAAGSAAARRLFG